MEEQRTQEDYGGAGSGNFGHRGRKGKKGGSLAGGGGVRVGITSARPGKSVEQVAKEMQPFKQGLEDIDGVTDVQVDMGRGGWEGGGEDTWVTQYNGNGEAISHIAKPAKAFDQDGAVVFERVSKNHPDAEPSSFYGFQRSLDAKERVAVEGVLNAHGQGGWTWVERNGKTTLNAANVPQWGGDKKTHLANETSINSTLTEAGFNVKLKTEYNKVTTLDEGNYDDYIK